MATLKDLASNIQYDSSWGVWAELIDGKFTPESQARYGQCQFENGGVLDEFEFVANGEKIGDRHTDWAGEFELHDYPQWDAIVVEFEKAHDCEWGGNRKEVEEWAKDSDEPKVAALVKASRIEFEAQCEENGDEWIDRLIEEMNEDLEARINY